MKKDVTVSSFNYLSDSQMSYILNFGSRNFFAFVRIYIGVLILQGVPSSGVIELLNRANSLVLSKQRKLPKFIRNFFFVRNLRSTTEFFENLRIFLTQIEAEKKVNSAPATVEKKTRAKKSTATVEKKPREKKATAPVEKKPRAKKEPATVEKKTRAKKATAPETSTKKPRVKKEKEQSF